MSETGKRVVVLEQQKTKKTSGTYTKKGFSGTGRRKTSIARVQLVKGSGQLKINGLGGQQFLGRLSLVNNALSPLKIVKLDSQYDVIVNIRGGGVSGSADAISLGVARALLELDANLRKTLKVAGFLTRDARIKERKKYGRKRARKGYQYRKR